MTFKKQFSTPDTRARSMQTHAGSHSHSRGPSKPSTTHRDTEHSSSTKPSTTETRSRSEPCVPDMQRAVGEPQDGPLGRVLRVVVVRPAPPPSGRVQHRVRTVRAGQWQMDLLRHCWPEFYHFAGAPSPILLNTPTESGGGCSRMAELSPTMARSWTGTVPRSADISQAIAISRACLEPSARALSFCCTPLCLYQVFQ